MTYEVLLIPSDLVQTHHTPDISVWRVSMLVDQIPT